MTEQVMFPSDPYSLEWHAFWRRYPHLRRSVGAAAAAAGEGEGEGAGTGTGAGEGEGEGAGEGEGDDPPNVDPKQFERLQRDFQKAQEELERFKAKHAEQERHRRKAEEDARKAAEEAHKKEGNIEALEKSWQEKLDASVKEKEDQIQQYEQMVSSLTVGQTSAMVAAEVFGEHADLMEHHVRSRLTYEMTDEGPKTRVLDAEGKPSALTLDDLKKEFKNNKKFAPFVVGTNASGAGSHEGGDRKGVPNTKTITRAEFDKMQQAERTAFHRKGGRVVED